MTEQAVRTQIEAAWNKQSHKMDWPGMESALRDVLLAYKYNNVTADMALELTDQVVAAFTKRGSVL